MFAEMLTSGEAKHKKAIAKSESVAIVESVALEVFWTLQHQKEAVKAQLQILKTSHHL